MITTDINIRKNVAKTLYNNVFPELKNDRITVCLLGANAKDNSNLRNRLREQLNQNRYYSRKLDIYYPEEIFSDLLYNRKIDLLSLENLLAKSIHVFIICLESNGAIAELGAFTNHEVLSKKLIVILDERYKKEKSFIRNGPIRYLELKRKPSPVMWFDYQLKDITKLTVSVRNLISRMASDSEIDINLHNPIIVEEFLLLLIYIIEAISQQELINYIKDLDKTSEHELVTIVCSGALSSLFKQRAVRRRNNEYTLTKLGYDRIMKQLPEGKRRSLLESIDNLRVDYINETLRKCK